MSSPNLWAIACAFLFLGSVIPTITASADVPAPTIVFESIGLRGPTAHGEDVYFAGVPAPNERAVYRGRNGAVETIVPDLSEGIAVTASGDLVLMGRVPGSGMLGLLTADGWRPFAPGSPTAAFGPDGRLYLVDREGTMLAVDGEGPHFVAADIGGSDGKLVFSPTGELFATRISTRTTMVIDIETGSTTPAPAILQGVLAFDSLGRGYRIASHGVVERVDPLTGDTEAVARLTGQDRQIMELTISTSQLFVTTLSYTRSWMTLESIPLGTTGFTGFHPAFDPPSAAELSIASFTDTVTGSDTVEGESHTLRAVVHNGGGLSSQPGVVAFGTDTLCRASCNLSASMPAIRAGGDVVVEVTWTGLVPGDFTAAVKIDVGDKTAESDETNNFATTQGSVLVGGNRALCVAAVEATTMPSDIAFVARRLACQSPD